MKLCTLVTGRRQVGKMVTYSRFDSEDMRSLKLHEINGDLIERRCMKFRMALIRVNLISFQMVTVPLPKGLSEQSRFANGTFHTEVLYCSRQTTFCYKTAPSRKS